MVEAEGGGSGAGVAARGGESGRKSGMESDELRKKGEEVSKNGEIMEVE